MAQTATTEPILSEHVQEAPAEKKLGSFERYLTVWVALCMVVGVLVEVPVMLSVCSVCNRTRHWFPAPQ